MTTDPNGARRDADDEATLAVLDMALAERALALETPDLWPLSTAAAPGPAASAAPARGRRSWLAAGLLLLALGAAATWAVSGGARDGAVQRLQDPDAPVSLPELQQRLANAEAAHASACGAWDDDARRWVPLPRNALDALFRFGLRPALDRDDLSAAVAAIGRASVVEGGTAGVVWSHALEVHCGTRRCTLLVQTGGRGAARVGFRARDADVELSARGFPFADLAELLDTVTAKTIASLGFVVGTNGFDAVPVDTGQLRLLGSSAGSVARLGRFQKLARLDLTLAPEWHRADVLRALPPRLQSLSCSPRSLAPDAFAAIAGLPELRELFLVGPDPIAVVVGATAAEEAPALDDGALRVLGRMRSLRELALAGGACTDDGLRALAPCGIDHLAVIACPNVRGATIGELPQLRELHLDGGLLAADLLDRIAALPLTRLSLRTRTAVRLDALPRFRALRELILDVPLDRGAIVFLERCATLEQLGLRGDPPLRDDELVLLHGLRQLRSLKLESPLVTAAGRDALRAALPRCTVGDELR